MEDDEYEAFVPLMKKRMPKALSSQSTVSFSQRSSFSTKQLSLKSYVKPRSELFPDNRSESFSLPGGSNNTTKTVSTLRNSRQNTRTKGSPRKKVASSNITTTLSSGFCPTCQVPFDILNVLPGVHAASCNVSGNDLQECPFGEECTALEILHYRDYSHEKLAQLRSAKGNECESPRKRPVTSSSSASGMESPVQEFRSPRKRRNVSRKKPPTNSVSVNETPKQLQCSEKGVMGLNFKGNVFYKEDDKNSNRKKHCIKSSTVPCDECSNCKAPDTPSETCVEMSLSPPPRTRDPSAKTPVKVNLMFDESGWKSMGVDMRSDAHLEELALAVCDCSHCLEMECTVKDSSSEATCHRTLEQKLFVNLQDLGVATNNPDTPTVNKQVTIVSSLKSDGGSSTKLDISVLSSPPAPAVPVKAENHVKSEESTRLDERTDSISDLETLSSEALAEEMTISQLKYATNESAKVKWKELLSGFKSKGFNTMSIMSGDSLSSSSSERGGKKTCPFYKRIPDTTFVVDAFQYGTIPRVTHYFLSHFHADHYGGLRKSFSKPIICSAITARLVKKKLGVDSRYLNVIELDQPLNIRQVTITALDANHCPGSLMFLFQLLDGRNFLHVGDFRADPTMESYPCFWNLTIDKLFLDTTYCNPKYTFPTQAETISQVVQVCRQRLEKNPATLLVSGTYTIGKEKVFLGIAEALDLRIWAKKEKRRVLECLNDNSLSSRLADHPWEAQVHVWSMMDFSVQSLKLHVQQCRGRFKEVVAFKPSGWELKMNGDPLDFKSYTTDGITIYSVPYSEHSSFSELRRFVQFLKPSEIIPTVNMGSAASRAAMEKHFKEWLSESTKSHRTHTQKQLTSYVVSGCKS